MKTMEGYRAQSIIKNQLLRVRTLDIKTRTLLGPHDGKTRLL